MDFIVEFIVERTEEIGGNTEYENYEAIEQAFAKEVRSANAVKTLCNMNNFHLTGKLRTGTEVSKPTLPLPQLLSPIPTQTDVKVIANRQLEQVLKWQ